VCEVFAQAVFVGVGGEEYILVDSEEEVTE
jgi:hypothetical protein